MSDHIVRFILDRVVADYVRLHKAGIAPPPELYADFWPEQAKSLLHDLLFTKFRLLLETSPNLSVEAFLRDHSTRCGDENLLLRLLEHELENADSDPNAETVRHRFPQIASERVTQTVELVQLRRSWKPVKKKAVVREIDTQNSADGATANFIGGSGITGTGTTGPGSGTTGFGSVDAEDGVTTNFAPETGTTGPGSKITELGSMTTGPGPVDAADGATTNFMAVGKIATPDTLTSADGATTNFTAGTGPTGLGSVKEDDGWTKEKSQTLQWTVDQPLPPVNDGTMDFKPVEDAPDGTMDFALTKTGTTGPGSLKTGPGSLNAGPGAPKATPGSAETPTTPASGKTERGGLANQAKEFTVSDSLAVDKYLGSGFWKDVYKAKQQSTRQFVALKHLREKNDAERETLVREVRTQAKLTHQNIPPVFGLDLLPSGQAIVIEKLVDGDRWSDSIKTRSLDDNLRILLEVSQAVAFAHRQHRIIHRDLKPDNVVVNDNYGEVYLIDWGLAADVGNVEDSPADSDEKVPHVSRLEGVAGTPLYWSPELAAGEPTKCCPATDVFLLGALLYEVLTGHAPYELCNPNFIEGLHREAFDSVRALEVGPMLRAVRGIIIPPRLRAPHRYIPEELLAVAMKSLERLPENRYTDAGDFIDAVKRYQSFSLITNRCDQNWKQFNALCRERDQMIEQPEALLSLTLRFLETSDIFRNVVSELQLHQIADEVRAEENDPVPQHPTLLSAQQGEVEARTELIALTLRSGDLTLADAQIGLVERNPFHDVEKTRTMKNSVRSLKTARQRARMMKWVAVGLLAIFLGSSTLYGYLINEQFKKTALQYRRAEENFQKAQNAVNDFYTTVAKDDAIKNSGLMQLRRKLLDSAKRYHEDFVSQKSDDPNVIAGQVGSLFDMANIETNFGNRSDAIDYYLKAIDLGNELVQKHPNNAKYLDILSKCYKDLGVVYGEERYPAAQVLECIRKGLVINRKLVAQHADVPEYHRNLARVLHNLGVVEMRRGNSEEAEKYFRDSLGVRDGMLRFDDPPEYHFGKVQTHFALALAYVGSNRFDDADREFETALHLLDELRETYPDRFKNDEVNLQGMILFGRGEMNLNENKPEIARSYLSRALEPFGILVEKAPEHIGYQRQLNNAQSLIFECLVREHKDDQALELFWQRETSLLETAGLFPDGILFLCQWYLRVAEFHLKRNRKDDAIKLLQNGFETLEVLGDGRNSDEERLFEKIQTRLKEVSGEQ